MNKAINLKQMNVLLAEDDIDDKEFFKKALEIVPLFTNLKTVSDGEELMAYLLENTKHLPHVLFLDINMPRKNGFECLTEIKENEKLKDLPVVMFSSSNSQDNINILLKTGANVYIRKPSDFMELVQVINHALPVAAENIFSNGKLKFVFNP
jgi:CheY-like chemotaxis protein